MRERLRLAIPNKGRLVDPTLTTWQRSGLGCDAGSGLLRLEALDPPAIEPPPAPTVWSRSIWRTR